MAAVDAKPFLSRSAIQRVEAERSRAAFGTGTASHHGTFRDVIAQLPRISAMGCDVLRDPQSIRSGSLFADLPSFVLQTKG